jgi:HlyD family secretion protein
MRRKTALVLSAVTLTVAAGLAWVLRPKPIEVESAAVVRGPIRVTVEADGRTRVRDRYVVAAPVSGRLRRIALREGDAVVAGQVVARIAPLPLDESTLRQGRARIAAAGARQREAEARVREARAAAAEAALVAKRREAVFAAGGISQEERDRALMELRSREETLRAAQASVRAAASEVTAANAVLLAAGAPGADVLVRSPCSGRVLDTPESSERVVVAGTPVLELGNPGALEVVIDVLSEDAVRVRAGQRADIVDWGGDGPLRAWVRSVGASAVTKLSALGVEEQRVDVVLDLYNPPPSIGDGFRVEARIVTHEAPSVMQIPSSALVRRGASWGLFAIEGGRARFRPVELGARAGASAELRRGPPSGTRVVVYPSDAVTDGVRVTAR